MGNERRYAIERQIEDPDGESKTELLRMFAVPDDWEGGADAIPQLGFREVTKKEYQEWLDRVIQDAQEGRYTRDLLGVQMIRPEIVIFDVLVKRASELAGRCLNPWDKNDLVQIELCADEIGLKFRNK